MRRIGMLSMGPVLQILGVKLLMIEDPAAMAWADARLGHRERSYVRSAALQVMLSRRFLQKIGALGGKRSRLDMTPQQARRLARNGGIARAKALSPERRREIAFKAVRARWAKRRKLLPANGCPVSAGAP
jgi:hypothetical protein